MSRLLTLDIITTFIDMLRRDERDPSLSDFNPPKMINNNSFDLTKTIQNIGDFPKNCRAIFAPFVDKIYRHPVTKFENVSFIYSVMYCIKKSIIEKDTDNFINILKEKMIADLTEKKLHMILKYRQFKWTIKDISDSIKNDTNDKVLIRYVADYFNINIFIVNITEDKVFAIFSEEALNIHKPTIFLSFYNNTFEPLTFESHLLWNNTIIFNKILSTDKNSIHVMNNTIINTKENLALNIEEDLEPYLVKTTSENRFKSRMGDILIKVDY